MKFKKLSLDESLFDDNINWGTPPGMDSSIKMPIYDDDFSISDYPSPSTETPKGPTSGELTGVADTIISLINDEWEAIQGYNNFTEMLKVISQETQNTELEQMLPVVLDIVNEENKHVGQLQELLKLISPNASSIEDGAIEGASQIASSGNEWVNGKLKVEVHTPISPSSPQSNTPNEIDTNCTLYNVDDEM